MQARSQKSAMGEALRGLGADPPTTGGNWSLGARPPATGGIGCGGRIPQHSKKIFFGKNNLILGLFWEKLMLLIRGIEISSEKWLYRTSCINGLCRRQGWEKSIVIDIRLRYSLLFFNRIRQILYFLEWVSNMLFSLVFSRLKRYSIFFSE